MKNIMIFILITVLSLPGLARKIVSFKELIKPGGMTVDDDQLYVLDGATIYIYSREEFKLRKKFGKAGEGPQEFKISYGMQLTIFALEDSLLIDSLGRASFFSKKGEFIKEINAQGPPAFSYQPIADGFVGMGYLYDSATQSSFTTLNIFDNQLKKLKEIYRQKGLQNGRFEFPAVSPIFHVVDNKIIVGGETGLTIHIYNAQGEKIKSIIREYKVLKVTKEYKERIDQYMKTNPQTKQFYDYFKKIVKFADTFPAIQHIYAADYKIYVLTYLVKDEKSEFLIFDTNGKFLKRLFVPFKAPTGIMLNPAVIKNDKFYQLVENEENEEWELHMEEIK